jgi:hypothetical protein
MRGASGRLSLFRFCIIIALQNYEGKMDNTQGSEEIKLKQDRYGHVVQILSESSERVVYCPIGGGPQRSHTPEVFFAVYDKDWEESWRQISVGADWMDGSVKAWSTGKKWNGWEVPYFELDQALEAMAFVPDLKWHPDRDCFEHTEEGVDVMAYEGRVISVQGRAIKVYQIGDGWCWDGVRDEPKSAPAKESLRG